MICPKDPERFEFSANLQNRAVPAGLAAVLKSIKYSGYSELIMMLGVTKQSRVWEHKTLSTWDDT